MEDVDVNGREKANQHKVDANEQTNDKQWMCDVEGGENERGNIIESGNDLETPISHWLQSGACVWKQWLYGTHTHKHTRWAGEKL